MAAKTLVGAPDPGAPAPEAVAKIRAALAARHGVGDDDLDGELAGLWFVIVDALTGVAVPAEVLRANLHDLSEVVRYARGLLPVEVQSW